DDVGDIGGGDDGDSGEASSEPLTVREQLKKSIEEVRAADEGAQAEKPKREKKPARADKDAKEAAPSAAPAAGDTPAPASLSPEAKQAWANAPKEIKEAFVKREADMQKGVDELK